MDEDQLAQFQSELLEILDLHQDEVLILAELKQNPAFKPFEAYLTGFEGRMVTIAAELVKKWGKRYSALSSTPPYNTD